MPFPSSSATIVIIRGKWWDAVTQTGVYGSITSLPLLAGGGAGRTPNLADLTAYGHIKTRQRVAEPNPDTGYYAFPAVANNDPDLDSYGGLRVTFEGEEPYLVEVDANAPQVAADQDMVDALAALDVPYVINVGDTVRAQWLVEAAVLTTPAPQPPVAYWTSGQTASAIATAVGGVAGIGAEQIQDTAAGLLTSGTHTGITFTYDDPGAHLNATVTVTGDLLEATGGSGTNGAYTANRTATNLVGVITRYETTSTAISQPLPAATTGRVLAIGWDAGANPLTVTAGGSDVIGSGSATSLIVPILGEVLTLHCTAPGRWRVVSGFKPQSVLDTRYLTRPGNRWVALGDSITAGSSSSTIFGEGWVTYAALMSQQRLHLVANAGVAGNTSAQMLARFDTDVTPYAPNLVTLLAGTNDVNQSVAMTTWKANLTALVAKIRAIGAVPVLATIPPRTGTSYNPTIIAWNTWLRRYAEITGLTVLDFHRVLSDPATGAIAAAYDSDGTHPTPLAAVTLAELAATALAPLVPNNGPALPVANTDAANLLTNGLFLTDGDANGVADSWTPGSNPAGATKALTTRAGVVGQIQRITLTSTTQYVLYQDVTTGWSVGDTVRFCGLLHTDGALPYTVNVGFTGNGGAIKPAALSQAVTRGVFCQDAVVPTGTTAIRFGLWIGHATTPLSGVVDVGQCGMFNLTAMGALS